MKKAIFFIPIFFFLTLLLFDTKDVFASSCSTYGNTTYCDDGTSYSQYGNTIYGSDGTNYSTYGNTTYGSDGTSYSQYGNTLYGSDGTSYSQYGNSIYGSDGSSYSTYGNTTYGSGGGNVFSSCPSNSSYDSLTGKCKCSYGYKSDGSSCVYDYSYKTTPTCPLNSYYDGISSCKCNYGYVVSGSSCVYRGTSYSDTPTYPSYPSNQNTCPTNSHVSATNTTKCECNLGYQSNSTKDGCVLAPIKTVEKIETESITLPVKAETKTSDAVKVKQKETSNTKIESLIQNQNDKSVKLNQEVNQNNNPTRPSLAKRFVSWFANLFK